MNLPGSLQQNRRLTQWLRFVPARAQDAEHVLLSPGKVEIGQGITTALAQIAAEELGLRLDQIQLAPASTASSPNETVTSGSLSIQDSGSAVRHACAQARTACIRAVADRLALNPAELECLNGLIHKRGEPGVALASFWTIDANRLLERDAEATSELTAPQRYRWVGQSALRRDLPAKFAGSPTFIQDLDLQGMHYAVTLRHLVHGRDLVGAEPERARRLAECARQVIHSLRLADKIQLRLNHCFVAMIAERRLYLDRAIRTLQTSLEKEIERGLWSSADSASPVPDDASSAMSAWFDSQSVQTATVFERGAPESLDQSRNPLAGRRWGAEFLKPWLAHASIGVSTAIACWRPDPSKASSGQLEVWTHSQGIFNLRRDLHLVVGSLLNILETDIKVHHVQGAGCYGHNGADDVALDAVLCAISTPDVPVRLQWTRSQEFSSAPFSPAMRVQIRAMTDGAHRLRDWHHELWSPGHSSRPGRAEIPVLLAASEINPGVARAVAINPPLASGGGADRNAVPAYNIPNVKVVNHRLLANPIRSSAFRGLGAIANVFALENTIEQIAADLGEDSLDFRLRHLDRPEDARARAVIELAASLSGWRDSPNRGRVHRETADRASAGAGEAASGLGMGFARYKNSGAWCCAVARVEVSDQVRVPQLWIAADAGLVINPDGARNQLIGGAVQATSIALFEQMRFARHQVSGFDWEQYRIIRFREVPAVQLELIERQDKPALGAGEASIAPVVAAIGNALAQALGFRMHSLPLSAERVQEALKK